MQGHIISQVRQLSIPCRMRWETWCLVALWFLWRPLMRSLCLCLWDFREGQCRSWHVMLPTHRKVLSLRHYVSLNKSSTVENGWRLSHWKTSRLPALRSHRICLSTLLLIPAFGHWGGISWRSFHGEAWWGRMFAADTMGSVCTCLNCTCKLKWCDAKTRT